MNTFLLIILGLCSGILVSGGVSGLLTSLSIFPRYAAITKSSSHLSLYEDVSFLGIVLGNVFSIFSPQIALSTPGLVLFGGFSGIFLGSWILALAEISQVFPVFFRRVGISCGFFGIFLSVCIGKILGSLLYYAQKW